MSSSLMATAVPLNVVGLVDVHYDTPAGIVVDRVAGDRWRRLYVLVIRQRDGRVRLVRSRTVDVFDLVTVAIVALGASPAS